MEGQAVRGHPWAGVGVLLSPRGVDESQAGVPCAGGVEEVDQALRAHLDQVLHTVVLPGLTRLNSEGARLNR